MESIPVCPMDLFGEIPYNCGDFPPNATSCLVVIQLQQIGKAERNQF
jgi:hypothetical protein